MTAMSQHFHPTMVDFSPTEVADLGLIGLQRSAVYNAIKRGHLHAVKDEHGHFRITQAEIDRYISKRHQERPDLRSRPADPLLFQAWQRERGRAGGRSKAARHSREELGEAINEGRRAWLERQVDPQHLLPPEERERRIQAAHEKQVAQARMAKIEKAMLKQQFSNEQA